VKIPETSGAPPHPLSPRLIARSERLGSKGDPLPQRGRGDWADPLTLAEGEGRGEGGFGRHRVLRMAPAMAAALSLATADLVELRGRHPAPLRAWVRVEPDAHEGQIALDALGRRILGVSPGDGVEVKHLPMPPIPGGLVSG